MNKADGRLTEMTQAAPREAAALRVELERSVRFASPSVATAAREALAAIEKADAELWRAANAYPLIAEELQICIERMAEKASGGSKSLSATRVASHFPASTSQRALSTRMH